MVWCRKAQECLVGPKTESIMTRDISIMFKMGLRTAGSDHALHACASASSKFSSSGLSLSERSLALNDSLSAYDEGSDPLCSLRH